MHHLTPTVAKLLYAILLSPLQPNRTDLSPPSLAPHTKRSRYRRSVSLIHLADRILPGKSLQMSRLMYRNTRFPWEFTDSELIAFGSGAAVIKLCWEGGEKVLRIYRKSLGQPLHGLIKIIRHYKRNYETLLSCYGSSTGLLLPLDFLILSGLPFSIPVAASLQPYVSGHKHDLFEDFSDEELLGLFEKHARLRKQFSIFARQTLLFYKEHNICFDFLGRENLMVVKKNERYRLCIVDVGLFRLDHLARHKPEKLTEVHQRLDRLVALHREAENKFQ